MNDTTIAFLAVAFNAVSIVSFLWGWYWRGRYERNRWHTDPPMPITPTIYQSFGFSKAGEQPEWTEPTILKP